MYSEYDALPDRAAAEDLRSAAADLPELGPFDTLQEVRDAVDARDETALRHGLAQGKNAYEKTIRKWFRHYIGGAALKSSVETLLLPAENGEDAEYLLVRSEMHSDRKAQYDDGDGKYHAVWVVGELPENEDHDLDYYIHRVEWTQQCEQALKNQCWNITAVRDLLGAPGGRISDADDPEQGMWYRVHGDVRVKFHEYDYNDANADTDDDAERWAYAQIDRHLVVAHGAIQTPESVEGVVPNGATVAVPGAAVISVTHPEHRTVELNVKRAIVEFDTLEQHKQH